MRIYFYGALLLAVSILLASFDGATARTNSTLSAVGTFANTDTIITNLSSEDFDHALARITSVSFIGGERGQKPMAPDTDTVDSLALQESFLLFADETIAAPGDGE